MKNIIKNNLYRKVLLGTVLVIVLAIAGSFVLSKVFGNKIGNGGTVANKEIATVQTKKILPETVTQDISVSATTKPSNEAKISSKTTGNIANIYFKEGDWVNVGQTVIRLEQDQTLLVAYDNAQTNLVNTRAAMKKEKKVAKVAVEISSGDEKKQAEANYSSVKKKVELQIAAAQGQLDSVQAQMDNTVIMAPVSGVINRIYIEKGEMILAGSPVVDIVNIKEIEIELSLTEFDIGKVSVGQEAEINLSAYPDEKFMGKICYVGLVADQVNKKFPVKIKLKNTEGKIKVGMIAQTNIVVAKQENILVIPNTAIFLDDNVEKVYLVNDDSKIKIVTIETEILGDKLKVIEGLIENDEIVVNGNYEFNEGEKIVIKN